MNHVVCLYEYSGLSALEFARAGYEVYCYDIQYEEQYTDEHGIVRVPWDARKPEKVWALLERHYGETLLMMAFPPCDDLAVSGAKHFQNKREEDPEFQEKAMELVYIARDIGEALDCPYFLENPISVISTKWRKPDFIFNPYEFGGYLPENDIHPLYPEYIPARDAYPKKTCLWTGGGFTLPTRKETEVLPGYSKQFNKLGGKSLKTKNIRSATPRGFSRALFEHYHPRKNNP